MVGMVLFLYLSVRTVRCWSGREDEMVEVLRVEANDGGEDGAVVWSQICQRDE